MPETEKERRERELAILLLALLQRIELEMRRLAEMAAVGTLTPAGFGQEATRILTDGHARAAFYGRRLAGNSKPFALSDRFFGEAVMRQQAPYLAKFVADLEGNRYKKPDGTFSPLAGERASMYAAVLLGTANEAWAGTLPDGTLFDWNLGPVEAHCSDCPRNAEEGPYALDDLPSFPGDGGTECLANCRCFLTTHDGGRGFDLAPLETAGVHA